MYKVCNLCGVEKALTTGFYAHPRGRLGYHGVCIECMKGKAKANYYANHTAIRARQKEYKRNNK